MDEDVNGPSFTSEGRSSLLRFEAVDKNVSKRGMIDLAHQIYTKLGLPVAGTHPTITIGSFMYGFYHILYQLLVDGTLQWLVKIPANGVEGRWNDESAVALASEANTMHYLSTKSGLPIPRVYAYSDTIDNSVGCPYIFLSYVHGVPLYKVWLKHGPQPGSSNASEIPEHQKRTLDGLIQAMAEMGKHTFPEGGSLIFSKPTSSNGHTFLDSQMEPEIARIGPARVRDAAKMLAETPPAADQPAADQPAADQPGAGQSALARQNVFKAALGQLMRVFEFFSFHTNRSTRTPSSPLPVTNTPTLSQTPQGNDNADSGSHDVRYLTCGPISDPADFFLKPLDEHVPDHPFQKGVHDLLRKLIHWIPDPFVAESASSRFVLRHPDLNMQNILVADDGTVVGIVDWDGVAAVPRCLGNECYPMFLTHDWNPTVYLDSPSAHDDNSTFDPDDDWEISPEMLSKLRNEYLRRVTALQETETETEAPFSPYLAQICRQSVVIENIAIAAYDPVCRFMILDKIVIESWEAYKKSTGKDYSDITLTDLVKIFNSGTEDALIVANLESAFLELLKTVA